MSRTRSATQRWSANSPHHRERSLSRRVSMDGGDTWRLRFSPNEEGQWRTGCAAKAWNWPRVDNCAARRRKGTGLSAFIRITPTRSPTPTARRSSRWATPAMAFSTTVRSRPELRDTYLQTRRAQRFNFVRMSVGHVRRAARRPGPVLGVGRHARTTRSGPIQPGFLSGLRCRAPPDAGPRDERGVAGAELVSRTVYGHAALDAARERQWLRYLIGALRRVLEHLPLDSCQRVRNAPRRNLPPGPAGRSRLGQGHGTASSRNTIRIGTL